MKGKFIVIEGTDGAGKTTQINLLEKFLKSKKQSYKTIDFPRYKDNEYGRLVERYLKGEFGALREVSPYLASLAYAGDRFLARPEIERWLESGKVVLANRYAGSNKAHMSVKLKKVERQKFVSWMDNLEYKVNKIPREDLVILLFLDPKIAQKNIGVRGRFKDIHEVDLKYQVQVASEFLNIAKQEKHWVVINCADKKGMKSPEKIHEEIAEILKKKGIL